MNSRLFSLFLVTAVVCGMTISSCFAQVIQPDNYLIPDSSNGNKNTEFFGSTTCIYTVLMLFTSQYVDTVTLGASVYLDVGGTPYTGGTYFYTTFSFNIGDPQPVFRANGTTTIYMPTFTCSAPPPAVYDVELIQPYYYDELEGGVVGYFYSNSTLSDANNLNCVGCMSQTTIFDAINEAGVRQRIFKLVISPSIRSITMLTKAIDVNLYDGSSTVTLTNIYPSVTPTFSGSLKTTAAITMDIVFNGPSVLRSDSARIAVIEGKPNRGTYLFTAPLTQTGLNSYQVSSLNTSTFQDTSFNITYTQTEPSFIVPYTYRITNPSTYEVFTTYTQRASPASVSYAMVNGVEKVSLAYPFSYGKGDTTSFNQSVTFLLNQYYKGLIYSVSSYIGNENIGNPGYTSVIDRDIVAPIITSFFIEIIDFNTMEVTIGTLDDKSGTREIKVQDYSLSINDLEVGYHPMSGKFKKRIDLDLFVQPKSQDIIITDYASNSRSFSVGEHVRMGIQFVKLPSVYPLFTINDIQSVHFTVPSVNVTDDTSGSLQLLFTLSANTAFYPDWKPKLKAIHPFLDDFWEFEGAWDETNQAYSIDFSIPLGTMEGLYRYQLVNSDITAELIQSKFNKSIMVYNELGRYIGPTIQVNASQSLYIFPDSGTIKWEGQIYTPIGIGYPSTISFSSNNDPQEYTVNINYDPQGKFALTYPLPYGTKGGTFYITKIVLRDVAGNVMVYDKYSGSYPMDPNITPPQSLTVQIQTPSTDVNPPVLESWSVTALIPNNKYRIDFSVSDDNSGISTPHKPAVYISNDVPLVVEVDVFRHDTNTLLSNYSAEFYLPRGFGFGNGVLLSVYGLRDNAGNFNGYSSSLLEEAGFLHKLTPYFQRFPTIYSIGSVHYMGGELMVVGDTFGYDMENIYLEVDCGQGFNNIFYALSVNMTHAEFNVNQPFSDSNCSIQIVSNGFVSGFQSMNVTGYTPPVSLCPKDCSGNGNCTQSGCQCSGSWQGSDCSKLLLDTFEFVPSGESPSVTVSVVGFRSKIYSVSTGTVIDNSGSGSSVTYSVSIINTMIFASETVQDVVASTVDNSTTGTMLSDQTFMGIKAITEVKIDDSIHANYNNLSWSLTSNVTNANTITLNYTASFQDYAQVNVSVSYYDSNVSTTYEFAGQTIVKAPQTIKYTVSISNYKFAAKLNQLKVLFNSYIQTNDAEKCNGNNVGYMDGEKRISWIEMRANQHILYGQFQQRGILDGRVQSISNRVEKLGTSQSSSSVVAVYIPYFENLAVLDPDFQVLVDLDAPTTCSDNGGENNTKWKTIVIAVVCGLVGLAIIVLGVAMFLKKYKWQVKQKVDSIKLSRKSVL